MTTEGLSAPGPEQQAAIRSTLARISSLHQVPSLEVGEMLGQFEQLDLLGVTGHPAIAAALKADGKIPEVADRLKADLEIARSISSRQEIERFQRLGVLLGVVEPPVAVPEAEDGEMARLREDAKGLADQAIQRGLAPREVYERFVPAADLSLLSLSQLREHAASLTPQELSQIPAVKVVELMYDGLLTVGQVAGLPEDARAKQLHDQLTKLDSSIKVEDYLRQALQDGKVDIKDLPEINLWAIREGSKAIVHSHPKSRLMKLNPRTIWQRLNNMEHRQREYARRTGRFLVGGVARMLSSVPPLTQAEIGRLQHALAIGYDAEVVYYNATNRPELLQAEDILVEKGKLELDEISLKRMEERVAKDPESFPLLAKYVREIKEAQAAKPPAAAAGLTLFADGYYNEPSKPAGPLIEAPTLLGEGSPFVDPESLMGGRITNRKVERVLYADDKIFPTGLGKWIKQFSSFEEAYPSDPGKWVYEPRPGQQAVIKRGAPGNTRDQASLVQERARLLKLNSLFSENDPSRPVKILGYGVDEQSNPYLILEDLSSQGFVPIDTYLRDHGLLQPREALELSVAVGGFLTEIHRQGIMHWDLGSVLTQSNIFWDPVNKRVRIIDWENSQDISLGGSKDYYQDRQALADMLFAITTGGRLTNVTNGFMKQPEGPLWQGLHPAVRRVIESFIWVKNDAFTPERTETILTDLKTALAEIPR